MSWIQGIKYYLFSIVKYSDLFTFLQLSSSGVFDSNKYKRCFNVRLIIKFCNFRLDTRRITAIGKMVIAAIATIIVWGRYTLCMCTWYTLYRVLWLCIDFVPISKIISFLYKLFKNKWLFSSKHASLRRYHDFFRYGKMIN